MRRGFLYPGESRYDDSAEEDEDNDYWDDYADEDEEEEEVPAEDYASALEQAWQSYYGLKNVERFFADRRSNSTLSTARVSRASVVDRAKQPRVDWLLPEILEEARSRRFTFMLVGRTGVGKSSTINTLVGKVVAPTGEFEPTTLRVAFYGAQVQGIGFTVIDTPGLCDALPELARDEAYLARMRSATSAIDCLLFVSPITERRLRGDEMRGIKLISQTFGADVWKRAVIALSFADMLSATDYARFLEARSEAIRTEIAKYAGRTDAQSIPCVAVTNVSESTPDGKAWLGGLYTAVFLRISERGALPFFLATASRLRPQRTDETSAPPPPNETSASAKPSTPTSSNAIARHNAQSETSEPKHRAQKQTDTSAPDPPVRVTYGPTEDPSAPLIVLTQQQQVVIADRVLGDPDVRKIPDPKRVLELFALGAGLGLNISGGNPVVALAGGAVFAAIEVLSWLARTLK